MEVLSFMSRKVYGYFVLKYVTLLMALISCARTQDNIPSFNVTCDSTGLHVKIAFYNLFSGIVYAKGHKFDPVCSTTKSFVLDAFLYLPLTACDTFVQENNPWITNTVVIQQHPLIKTVNDLEKSVTCSFENFWDSTLLLDHIYEYHSLPLTDIQLVSNVFHKDNARIFDYSFTQIAIFQLQNRTIYNDIGIKSCIAHNDQILVGNASFHQITNPEGCFINDSENSSLRIIRTDESLTAYAETKNLKMDSSDSFYIACEVILCRNKCRCSEIDQQKEHSTSVISHKLTKRSTDNSSEVFLKQYEARTRYLKSTVKALMDRIMEQRKQNDKPKIRKRLVRLDDSFLSEANSFGSRAVITTSEMFSPEPISTEFNNTEHNLDVYDDNDPDGFFQDYDPDDSRHDYSDKQSYTTDLFAVDSGMIAATLSKKFHDNETEIVSEEFQGKGTTILSDVSFVNETIESIKTAVFTPTSVFPPVVEVGSDHLGSCVPRLRFVIVIVAMGFFIGFLLLVSCGMALYIRKEKKRNKLNDFLLYSIGF